MERSTRSARSFTRECYFIAKFGQGHCSGDGDQFLKTNAAIEAEGWCARVGRSALRGQPFAGGFRGKRYTKCSGSNFRPRIGSLFVFSQLSSTAAYTERKSTVYFKSPWNRSAGARLGYCPSK